MKIIVSDKPSLGRRIVLFPLTRIILAVVFILVGAAVVAFPSARLFQIEPSVTSLTVVENIVTGAMLLSMLVGYAFYVRLIEWRKAEKPGCAQFRKVASWYTKSLRMPKQTQHRFNNLNTLAEFDELTAAFRESGPPPGWTEWDATAADVNVPQGPNSHW